jgi:hypothetical protein
MSNRLKSIDPAKPASLYRIVETATGEVRYIGCTTSLVRLRMSAHQSKGIYRPELDRFQVIAKGPLDEMRKREVALINEFAPAFNVHHNPRHGLQGEPMLPEGWPRKNASTPPAAPQRRARQRARRAALRAAGLPIT